MGVRRAVAGSCAELHIASGARGKSQPRATSSHAPDTRHALLLWHHQKDPAPLRNSLGRCLLCYHPPLTALLALEPARATPAGVSLAAASGSTSQEQEKPRSKPRVHIPGSGSLLE